MVSSKGKGNRYENIILKQLKVLEPMTHKTLGSGNSKDDKGDIRFPGLLIEVKHHKKFSKGLLDKFWVKIVEEAKAEGIEPLLLYKENFKPAMVMFYADKEHTVRHMMYWDEYYKLLERAYV